MEVMNKEQSGKIDMLTGILNLPVIILGFVDKG